MDFPEIMASVLEFERASATLSDTANMVFKLRNPVATQKLQDDITVLRKQSTTFYDSEISRLMDMVQYLQASQIRTRNMLDHAQYARSPIARLLIENLSLIFLFVNNNPPTLVLGEMTRNHKAAHADVAGLRHVCREWKHIVASIPELHHIVVNIDPYWSPPRTNFWLNAYFIESTDDTPIDWVIHPWEFHDGFHDTYSSKRCECEWCVDGIFQYRALPGEPKHGLLYVLAETASRTRSVTVFLSDAGQDWLVSHTSPSECLHIPNRVPPFFPILTSVRLDFGYGGKLWRHMRAPLALFSNAPKLVKVSFEDTCKSLALKKIILPWQQLRDLSIDNCLWKDIRRMLAACVALRRLCLRHCKPFESVCGFLSLLENNSGEPSELTTHAPKYFPRLEALDLVLAQDECDAASYNDLHRVVQARCEHPCPFSQLIVGFDVVDETQFDFLQKLEELAKDKQLEFRYGIPK